MNSGNVPDHLLGNAVAKVDGMSPAQCAACLRKMGEDPADMTHGDMQKKLKTMAADPAQYEKLNSAMSDMANMIASLLDLFGFASVTKSEADGNHPPSDYLVVKDAGKPSTWHLRVKNNGKPDHTLMGAAWAALHGGYRGNKYEGPGKEEAISKLTSLYKSEKMPVPGDSANASEDETEIIDLFFTDLSDFEHISTIDGLPVTGKKPLIDMHGREVIVKPEDLPSYIENTQRVLESTRDSQGKIVGIPIDLNKHDHQGGAGWIVGLEIDQARNIIRLAINWTEDGIAVVKNNIRRFFSATFDPIKKVILGGTLTNSPATRTDNYEYMLRPIELSQTLKELDMDKTIQDTLDAFKTEVLNLIKGGQAPTPPAAPPAPKDKPADPVNLSDDDSDKLVEMAENIAKTRIRDARRKDHVVEFAASLTGGTKERPFGLPMPQRKLVKLLLKLPEDVAAEVEEALTMALEAAIDFTEHGINGEGYMFRPKLPVDYAEPMRLWVEAGKSVESFFAAGAPGRELKREDYNLAEFVELAEQVKE